MVVKENFKTKEKSLNDLCVYVCVREREREREREMLHQNGCHVKRNLKY